MQKQQRNDNKNQNDIKKAIISMSQCISTKSYQSANKLLAEKKRCQSLASSSQQNNSKISDYETKKCFSVNLDFLETITVENPAVQELLKELNINDKNIDIHKIVKENQDYFHHLSQNCACFKCTCCNCRCNYDSLTKLNYKSGYNTQYKKNYKFGLSSSTFYTPELNLRYYEQKPFQTPFIEMQTQQRKAFTAHPLQMRYKRQLKKNQPSKQFLSTTTYQQLERPRIQKMYPDWKDHDPDRKISAPKHVSTHSGIPLLTVTSYNKDFNLNRPKTSIVSAQDVKQLQHHQTYSHITPTYFQTTYGNDFRKHNNQNYINSKTEPNVEVYVPLRGHTYDTASKKAYSNGHVVTECQGTRMKKILKLRNQSAQILSAYLQEICQKQ